MTAEPGPIFLDTAYVLALVNTHDQWHPVAVQWEARLAAANARLVTTEFVLTEIADGLSAVRFRLQAAYIIDLLRADRLTQIVPVSTSLFAAALDLYRRRGDKGWGLTDCSSFIVMSELSVSAVLTTDEHFRQAGFHALLLEDTFG